VVGCCPGLGVAALGEPQASELAAMFKALGDPVRLRLFSLIASHPLNRSGWEATKPAESM